MTDPYLAGVVAILAAAPILVAVAYVLDRWLTPPEDAQPLVHAEPAYAEKCRAAHCGNAAFIPADHVDGTVIWLCVGDLERGCREGWIVPAIDPTRDRTGAAS